MPKKYVSTARFVKPDARHQSLLAQKLINSVMKEGKKHKATGIFYDAMAIIEATKVL